MVEADDLKAVTVQFTKRLFEFGHFRHARRTPCGPKIQQDDLSSKILRGNPLAVNGDQLEFVWLTDDRIWQGGDSGLLQLPKRVRRYNRPRVFSGQFLDSEEFYLLMRNPFKF